VCAKQREEGLVECVPSSNQTTEREGVGPSEEKECRNCGRCFHRRDWNRRSALESACGSPSMRGSQMWNGDLNRQRAKAINQMIMGMIDVPISNNQHASLDEDVDDGVHGVWMLL